MEKSQIMCMWALLGKVTKGGKEGKKGNRKERNGKEDVQGRKEGGQEEEKKRPKIKY